MNSVLATARAFIGSLKYELVRIGNPRSLRGPALFAFFGAALLTLPAARHIVGFPHPQSPLPILPPTHPMQPVARPGLSLFALGRAVSSGTVIGTPVTPISGPAWASALLNQYSPMHGGGGWVVAGGVAGMVLPGAAAACAAAWFGATAIGYEYRCGNGLLTFVLLPRRAAVLVAKTAVAAGVGALLCLGATVFAYSTARLGFRGTGVRVALPLHLMLPDPRAVALAALCGALGVVGGVVLRSRLLATVVALAVCSLVAAFLPHTTSLAAPYIANAALRAAHFVPGVNFTSALVLMLTLPLTVLMLSGLVAVRRRRVA